MLQELLHDFHWLHSAEGINYLLVHGGLIALAAIIFAETGLLVGFFLPGDSLLITAGIFANPEYVNHVPGLSIVTMNIILVLAAVIGDQVGFYLGGLVSNTIWNRPDGRFYKKKYLVEAHEFYEKHGGWAIVAARFIPVMRTFVPFAAGVAKMPYRSFVFWNISGGVVWVTSLLWAGYLLANYPAITDRIDKVLVIVVLVSVLPIVYGAVKKWLQHRKASSQA